VVVVVLLSCAVRKGNTARCTVTLILAFVLIPRLIIFNTPTIPLDFYTIKLETKSYTRRAYIAPIVIAPFFLAGTTFLEMGVAARRGRMNNRANPEKDQKPEFHYFLYLFFVIFQIKPIWVTIPLIQFFLVEPRTFFWHSGFCVKILVH
jgi:hypothetical protein